MGEHDVTVTRTIHVPASRVWDTLTDPDLVKRWMMGAAVDSTWQEGAPITWSGSYEGTDFTDRGEVLRVEKGERLVHTHVSGMSEDAAEHELDWRLAEDEGTTKLTLVQKGATSEEEQEQFRATWSGMLDALREAAEG